jgi:hypothetical protein
VLPGVPVADTGGVNYSVAFARAGFSTPTSVNVVALGDQDVTAPTPTMTGMRSSGMLFDILVASLCDIGIDVCLRRHCEERSDEAIHLSAYAVQWIASLRSQ